MLLLLLWCAQVVLGLAIFLLWVMSAWGSPQDRPFGNLNLATLQEALRDDLVWKIWGVMLAVATVLQALMLVPVRRPAATGARGWPLHLSMAAAGAAAAILLVALVFAGLTVFELLDVGLHVGDGTILMSGGAVLLAGWGVATPLLVRFARRRMLGGERLESVLGRVSANLFLGTVVEIIAIIPLDVMARRKLSCYCGAGTFLAMLMCMSVGMVAFGPGILLPMLARRRKRWYGSHCDCCGYDMSGLMTAERPIDRCPECGAGWRRDVG